MIPAQDRPRAEALAKRLQLRSRAEVPAIPNLRGLVVAYAESVGVGPGVIEKVRLAVSEAITNSVVHAYPDGSPGEVTVEAWIDEDGEFVVVVLDDGNGFRTVPSNPGMGIGLGLMAEMSDSLSVGTRDGRPGTCVALRFAVQEEAPTSKASVRTFVQAAEAPRPDTRSTQGKNS